MTLDRRLVIGVTLIGALAFGGRMQAQGRGDTPVILIGDSLIFKTGDQANKLTWTERARKSHYLLDPGYKISTIVVKSNAPPDKDDLPHPEDADSTKDKATVKIRSDDSWEVRTFTGTSGKTHVASLASVPGTTEIHLVLKDPAGTLCPATAHRIVYGHAADCSDKLTFDRADVLINGRVKKTLTCSDESGARGKCRIVLRK